MDASTRVFERPGIRYGFLVGGVAVALVAVIGLILVLRPPGGEQAGRQYTAADLGGIVFSDADAPPGTTPAIAGDGRELLRNPVWYLSRDEQQAFVDLEGFVDARERSFEGPASEGDLLYVSEAFLFEDAGTAQAAIDAYSDEWQESFGLANPLPTDVDLGDGGLLFSGPAQVQYGEPGFYYFWRVNNLVLNAVGIGDVEGEQLEALQAAVEAMALEMNRRAQED